MSQISTWLQQAGLSEYTENFEELSTSQFIAITIQDYGQYGINNLEDKEKLFRLITQLKNQPVQQVQPVQEIQQSEEEAEVQEEQRFQQEGNPTQQQAAPAPHIISRNPHNGSEQNSLPEHLPAPSLNPNIIPNASPSQRGQPTTLRTVVPPDDTFLNLLKQKIRVVVRKRPLNQNESNLGQKDICSADGWNQLSVHEPKVKVDLTKYIEVESYRFDQVFNEYSDNYEVYFYAAKPLVQAAFTGMNTTCFAYGQTGSGKTWTMMQRETGVYVLAANDVFSLVKNQYSRLNLTVEVSFFEIYGGKLFDLLNNRARLEALEDGKGNVQIPNLASFPIESVDDLLSQVDRGLNARSVGATGANADSSRSHAILQIKLLSPAKKTHGEISFIDLAGAERASDVENTDRQTRMEGAEINKSLLALKECIRAMDKNAHHLPFRGSKLTMVLRDSFIGNAQTVMIACVSPGDGSSENTLNTLRYADRVKASNEFSGTKQKVIKPYENACELIVRGAQGVNAEQEEYEAQMRAMKNGNAGNAPEAMPQESAYQVRQNQPEAYEEVSMADNPYAQNRTKNETPLPEDFIDADSEQRPPSRQSELEMTHQNIVDSIYDLEDEITKAHRKQVDQMMINVKEEVTLLHAIENDQITIDDWVQRLEGILGQKETAIKQLRGELGVFKQKLAEEQELSESYGAGK